MAPAQNRMEEMAKFKEDVATELVFMKQFPILDDTAMNEAEKERKAIRAELRNKLRKYVGPPLLTDEAIEAEKRRKDDLRITFNRESARLAKVKFEAKIQYQKWLNPILMKMSADADIELFDTICKKVETKGLIANKEAEKVNIRETNNI